MADIKKELNDIKNAVYGREVRGAIHDGIYKVNRESEGSRQIANDTKQRQDAVEQQFNTLLSEWSDDKPIDNAETIAARTNTKESKTYENLGKRLDEEYGKVTEQLAKTTKVVSDRAFYTSIANNKKIEPTLVIIDDDGNPSFFNKVYPMALEEQVPIVSAVITSRIDTEPHRHMTLEQLKEIERNGMEVVSHSHNHLYTAELEPEEQEFELKKSREILLEHGFKGAEIFVYPFGSTSVEMREKLVSKYYRAAIWTSGPTLQNNYSPIPDIYMLTRIPFNQQDGTHNLQDSKDKIDEAKAKNGLMISMVHSHYNGFDVEKLRELIQYAKAQGVKIKTASEAINMFSNYIDIPGLKIGANGEVEGHALMKTYNLLKNKPSITSPPGAFPPSRITAYTITVNDSSLGFPGPGTLIMYNPPSPAFARQEFIPYRTNKRLSRYWDAEKNEWTDFVSDDPDLRDYNLLKNKPSITSPPGAFPPSRITAYTITVNDSSLGFPGPGTLIMYNPPSPAFARQEFIPYRTNKRLSRYWDAEKNEWTDFE